MMPMPLISLLLFLCARPSLQTDQIPESCDNILVYRELGCTPVFETGKKCPVSYDCNKYQKLDPKMCYYNGQTYKKGATLERAEACHPHCLCGDAYPDKENAAWNCAQEDCFQGRLGEGCVARYNGLKDCCRNSTYCEGKDPKPAVTCSFKGQKYVEGQIMNDDTKCKRCICNANFKETLEGPSCETVHCKTVFHYAKDLRDGCVPVYYGKAHCSCPIDRKCPVSTDVVLQRTQEVGVFTPQGRTCKFGSLQVKVGEKLKKNGMERFECSCQTPPFITCIQPSS